MKIGLVTVHNACNYGAILQAYATQKILSQFGCVEIINYENRHVSRSMDLIRIKMTLRGALGIAKDIIRVLPRSRVLRKFRHFFSTRLQLTQTLTSMDILGGSVGRYDVLVAGSDQIWNPSCINASREIDPVYFLRFGDRNTNKLSYGSSLGSYKYSISEGNCVADFLEDFSHISVRENDAQSVLSDLTGRSVSHVLDPTLLLTATDWLNDFDLPAGSNNASPYILLYTVPRIPLLKKVVRKYREQLDLKVVAIDQSPMSVGKVDRQIRDAGPEEFVELVNGASFIITDSFHGVCFSLIFEKPFVAVSEGAYSNRIKSLLDTLGCVDRLIQSESDLVRLDAPLYDSVPLDNLEDAKSKSIEFLCRALG